MPWVWRACSSRHTRERNTASCSSRSPGRFGSIADHSTGPVQAIPALVRGRFSPWEPKRRPAIIRTMMALHPGVRFEQQILLVDADDTLWENNIYFERAIADFISYLDHRVHTPDEVRSHLNRVEHQTIRDYGYGLQSFHRSLVTCFEQLS